MLYLLIERYHDPSWEIKKALELKRFLVKKFEHLEGRDGWSFRVKFVHVLYIHYRSCCI